MTEEMKQRDATLLQSWIRCSCYCNTTVDKCIATHLKGSELHIGMEFVAISQILISVSASVSLPSLP